MHRYASQNETDKLVYVVLVGVSVLLGYALYSTTKVAGILLPWWVSAPTPLAVFGVVHWVFDRWLWRVRFPNGQTLSAVPDVRGVWNGTLVTDYPSPHVDNTGEKLESDFSLAIRQTWRRILVTGRTANSESRSRTAAISDENGPVLQYTYQNSPSNVSVPTMKMHGGTCELRLIDDRTLKGEYYTDRNRRTTGTLSLSKSPTRIRGT